MLLDLVVFGEEFEKCFSFEYYVLVLFSGWYMCYLGIMVVLEYLVVNIYGCFYRIFVEVDIVGVECIKEWIGEYCELYGLLIFYVDD